MAIFTVTFRSSALNHDTTFEVVIPEECPTEDIPTLYLLHGMHGSHSSWCRKSSIERYAAKHKIAVVCPDGENSFYCDMKYGKKYYTYITEELLQYTRKIFKLSHKREKTFIGGLSMGGYGAFRLALMRPDIYCAAFSLSGAVDIISRLKSCPWPNEAIAIWGENFVTDTENTDVDIKWLIKSFPDNMPKPYLFLACGTEDYLYDDNIRVRDLLAQSPFEFSYEEGKGAHTWAFGDKWVNVALNRVHPLTEQK